MSEPKEVWLNSDDVRRVVTGGNQYYVAATSIRRREGDIRYTLAQDHSELIANARRLYHGSRFKMDGSEMVVPLEDWEKIVAALGESV
jgi:hypothetical protein